MTSVGLNPYAIGDEQRRLLAATELGRRLGSLERRRTRTKGTAFTATDQLATPGWPGAISGPAAKVRAFPSASDSSVAFLAVTAEQESAGGVAVSNGVAAVLCRAVDLTSGNYVDLTMFYVGPGATYDIYRTRNPIGLAVTPGITTVELRFSTDPFSGTNIHVRNRTLSLEGF